MSAQDAAGEYLARGWLPIPVPFMQKAPLIPGWQKLHVTAENVGEFFNGANRQNIGILLGEPSGGLTDIDLDCIEAVRAARHLLPDTGTISGRNSSPASHYWFVCSGVRTRKYVDPDGSVLVEVRGGGCQTIVPPSVHPSGEIVEWLADNGPSKIEGTRLTRIVGLVATAALVARHWPSKGRHDAALALAGGLKRAGWGVDQATVFMRAVADAARDEEAGDRVRAVSDTYARDGTSTGWPTLAGLLGRDIVGKACEWLGAQGTIERVDRGPANDRTSPVIEVCVGELPRIVQDALGALKNAEAPIYLRGDALYRPVRIEAPPKDDDHVRRPVGAVVLRPIDSVWARFQLASAAEWLKWDKREKKALPADPPKDIAEVVATQSDIGAWPVLCGVVSHPVLTQRGRVISDPGYDPASGLLLEITGDWPIPAAPTRDNAIAAWERLKALLRYFPWAGDVDRAVALAMLMTAIARPALPAAPMPAIDAPEAGTGKSLLIDVASILASGIEAPVMDYGRDAVEAGKRLDAMLIAGDPLIAIDNVEAPIEGAALCQTLTQTTRRIRVLGLSKVVTVPCMAMVTVTGNNLMLRGDIVRRVLLCRLDAETERPELRDFDQDLIAEASEYRRHLVADIITIMLAYQRAGAPDVGVPRFGGYESWSSMVRQALVWVGEVDPCLSMERTRGGDPSRQDLSSVLEAWHAAFGEDAVTATAAVKEAWDGSDLRVALAAVCERRGVLDTRALGNWLRAHRDRRSGGLVLRSGPPNAHSKVAQWVVSAGSAGSAG